ncbi:helix-turn-helix domain-containing protein [uncultured Microbacterium sp.]|uniref:AlbA family DNA-binding domain-containing protein n=1 Tax=uncultured Microbacterium sp. TaxID=191216 RepID=UPI0025FA00E6|nr:ATP-binding protein [uncultured Microbacterium sp.]
MPRSEMLVEVAGALPLALLLSFVIAWVLRRLFGARLSLPLSVMTIVSLLGVSLGLFLAGWFFVGLRLWMPTALLLAAGSSLGLSFLVAGVAALLRRDGAIDVAALLEKGESDRVEFKETARWNVRDDKKDARMEQVVAKTVAAFLNSSGGTLLIGVDDDGRVHGLDRDFATLRTPDADRFELWLRDMLTASLGKNAAAMPRIRFAEVDGATVCAVRCPRAPEPVFVVQGGGTELWVRVGNSTRAFGVDEAVTYVARHFRPTLTDLLLGRR